MTLHASSPAPESFGAGARPFIALRVRIWGAIVATAAVVAINAVLARL
jgi:hypothetical protein